MIRKINFLFLILFSIIPFVVKATDDSSLPYIEVTGSASMNIVPDRITIEIGLEEYYKPRIIGDSMIVRLPEIEKKARKVLNDTGIPDSEIVITEIGNYKPHGKGNEFLMAKRLAATVTDFSLIEKISERLERKGITSLNIIRIDNSNIEQYNRDGLKAALKAAREKAEFIAESENLKLLYPQEILEVGPNYYETPSFSNVSFDSGAGMDNFRRIDRRYAVKVKYVFTNK